MDVGYIFKMTFLARVNFIPYIVATLTLDMSFE